MFSLPLRNILCYWQKLPWNIFFPWFLWHNPFLVYVHLWKLIYVSISKSFKSVDSSVLEGSQISHIDLILEFRKIYLHCISLIPVERRVSASSEIRVFLRNVTISFLQICLLWKVLSFYICYLQLTHSSRILWYQLFPHL